MLADAPAVALEMFFAELDRLRLECGRDGIVPAIQKTVQRDRAGQLDDLRLGVRFFPELAAASSGLPGIAIWV